MNNKKWQDLTDVEKKPFYDHAVSMLQDLYACDRVWEAWRYGMMSEDDFSIAQEDNDIVEGKAVALYSFVGLFNDSMYQKGV